jgi:hypothetical protein
MLRTRVLRAVPKTNSKRSARQTPLWDNVMFTAGMVVFAISSAGCMYGVRQAYFYLRGDGDDIAVIADVKAGLRRHPEWTTAMTYITVHHAMSDAATPFASPLIVPPEFEAEAAALAEYLGGVIERQPQALMADLWVCASQQSLSAVGGPLPAMRWGRIQDVEPARPYEVLAAPARDTLGLKKHLAGRNFTIDEIVALVGHRTLGCHGVTCEAQRGALVARASPDGAGAAPTSAPTAARPASGSTTPGLFDSDYYACLLNGAWAPRSRRAPADLVNARVPHTHMAPLDMLLLGDAMLQGWAAKFAENEVRFFNCYQRAMDKVYDMGWEGTPLRV